jgi:hypothetical protein
VASSEEGIELIAGEEVEREISKRGTTGAEAEVIDGRESKTEAASSGSWRGKKRNVLEG